MAPVLSNCVILQEKERLGQEWRRLEEQRSLFERERRKFTEAAIRLGEEVTLALHVNELEVTFETKNNVRRNSLWPWLVFAEEGLRGGPGRVAQRPVFELGSGCGLTETPAVKV